MDAIDASVQRLRDEIAKCEAQLTDLKTQLREAEEQKRDLHKQSPVENGRVKVDGAIENGGEATKPSTWPLSQAEYKRYGRQLIMPEIGLEGQLRLRSSRVLIVGAGGLGCPAAAYLTGAGIGELGLVDGDTVDESNLHRQILHTTPKVGMKKVDSAVDYLRSLNPHVKYTAVHEHLRAETALDIFDNYDVVLDCTDNPASRYLISDACVLLSKPLVSASALKTDGQLMVFNYPSRPPGDPSGGPCYRCMFPKPPPPESVQTCGGGGILGPVVGVMGVLQALEAIKLVTSGELQLSDDSHDTVHLSDGSQSGLRPALLFSANSTTIPFRSFKLGRRRKNCAACSALATVSEESLRSGSLDYVQFCGAVTPVGLLRAEERISATHYEEMYPSPIDGRTGIDHVLIDTREPVQFRLGSIPGSWNIPFSVLTSLQDSSPNETASIDTDILSWSDPVARSQTVTSENVGSWFDSMRKKPDLPIYTVCRLGNDSQVAVGILRQQLKTDQGDRNGQIMDIAGGLASWRLEVDSTFPDY